MKKFLLLFLILNVFATGQTVYQDYLLDNSIYKNAPEETRNRKPFIREWKFFDDRAFPDGFIPKDAYVNAVKQRDELRKSNAEKMQNVSWVSLGPTSGYYFSWGNVSSRMVTGAYNNLNPDIIYVGPANGGVWKSVNGGINWQPLTDYQPSLSMGCIVLDPINPDIIYAGTGEATYSGASYYGAGLLKSTDAGATWIHITAGLPAQTYFSRIAIRPGHNNEMCIRDRLTFDPLDEGAVRKWNLVFSTKDKNIQEFIDTSVIRGIDYYYAVTAVDNGSQNTTGFNPGGKLESSRYVTMSMLPAVSFKPGLQTSDQVRVVPNPATVMSGAALHGGNRDKISFFGLPIDCKLKIFTESGELVWERTHYGTSDHEWDQKTDSNQYATLSLIHI